MKKILIAVLVLALVGCGRISDQWDTGVAGYSVRCIEGTKYELMASDTGSAVAPLLGTNGLPKGCDK